MIKRLKTNSVRKLLRAIAEQFGCEDKRFTSLFKGFAFFQKGEKIYIVRGEPVTFLKDNTRVDSVGLYFCKEENDGVRLSMEGSWLISPFAKKNVLEVGKEEAMEWMKGNDLVGDFSSYDKYVIVRYGNYVLGCGKITKNKNTIKNFVPKERRVSSDLPFP